MANDATFTMTFKIREDGSLVLAEKNIKKAGKAVSDLGTAQENAAKSTDRHTRAQNGGVASANNAGRSMSKLLETVGGNNSGLVAAYATLATNAFAVSAAFSVLRNASQSEQVMKGLEVQGARLGITLTNTAKSIQEISRGSLSMADSMQAAAQASAAGFTTKNITDLTTAAQNASIALGRNMPDSLDRMIKGTTKLEPELLDELGVMVKLTEANNKYALANGKTALALTATEKRQAFLNAVLEESNRKFGGLSEQVDANPYDRLAATFDNLVKDLTKFIDTTLGVRNIVAFLADNTEALVSVLVLFASTISRQLIPSLYQASAEAERATKIINTKIEVQKRSIAVTLLQAKAEKELAATSATSKVNVVGSPERVKAYVAALKEGTVVEGQREKALRSLNGALGGHESALRKITNIDSEAYKNKSNLISDLKKQKTVLETLTTAELNHDNVVTNSQTKLDGLRRQSVGLRLSGVAQISRANAIELAGQLDLGRAYGEGLRSIVAHKRGLDNVAKGNLLAASTGGVFTKGLAIMSAGTVTARAAIFGLSVGLRALGAVVLSVIPIVGQLLLVWELLKEAYRFVKDIFFPDPAGTKELQAAVDAHNEILKSTQETAKITSSIFGDTGRSSAQITQGLTSVSNKINEIVDSYEEVDKRTRALGTDAAKQLSDPAKAISLVSGEKAKEESKVAVESLSALRTLGYEPLVKEIDEAITSNKAFWESSGQEQAATATKLLSRLKDKYGELGDTAKSISDNYKKISDSYDAFVTAAAVKTPFDDLVKNWDEQSVQLDRLKKQLDANVISLEDFGKQVNQIRNQSTINFIDDTSIKQLEYIKELEAYRARQQELYNSGKVKGSVEQLNVLRSIDSVTATITEQEGQLAIYMVEAQLSAAAELVSKQKTYALAQGELKIVQAKLQANAAITSSGEEGLRYRLKLEKESRDIQIRSLEIQKSIIEARISSSEAQLKFEQDSLDREKQKTLELAKQNSERIKGRAIELGVDLELLQKGAAPIRERGAGNAGNSAQVTAQKDYLSTLTQLDEAEKSIANRAIERGVAERALEIQNRGAKLSVLSLEKEIQAIQEQGLSAGKTEALISQARLNRIAKEREDYNNLQDQAQSLVEVERKRNVLLSGNAESFSEEVRSIKEAATADRRRALTSYESQRLRLLG